jgi:hypothetical protein
VARDHYVGAGQIGFVILKKEEGQTQVAQLAWEDAPLHETLASRANYLQEEAAQQLMNALWECGIRPAQAAGSAGQLEAQRAHLEDLRRLVFDKAPVREKPSRA